ncbi:MAG: hypothetical protein COB04_19170 [Gammaproteobacteria bacterium]|nr:MAG: hypothetical protein COB04_19170 [Gammaproteobacteria bacterium]
MIASLHRALAPLDEIKGFGEQVYSKLVFSYMPAPDYKASGMLMILFTVSEGLWHSVIWHCPERNQKAI